MTHAELVERAEQWLKRMGCPIVFAEMVTLNTEVPDAIGWRNSGRESFMVECKASRSDFLADKHKAHRWEGARAVGGYRYYMTPAGLVKPEEVPERWGLLWCHAKTVELVRGKHPRRWSAEGDAFRHDASHVQELSMLYSALNRLRIDLGAGDFAARIHMTYSERKRLKPEVFS